MGPYKCPECGVWWAGLEHRCDPRQFSTTTNVGHFTWGHCHGCSSAVCPLPDDRPCNLHVARTTM